MVLRSILAALLPSTGLCGTPVYDSSGLSTAPSLLWAREVPDAGFDVPWVIVEWERFDRSVLPCCIECDTSHGSSDVTRGYIRQQRFLSCSTALVDQPISPDTRQSSDFTGFHGRVLTYRIPR